MAYGSQTAAYSKIVKEEIARGIRENRIKIDPLWDEIKTGMGVVSDGLGRDWKFKKSFITGEAGAYEFRNAATLLGPAEQAGSTDELFAFNGAPVGWPTRTQSIMPAFFDQTVTLKEARGNLFLPLKWMQLDQFDSSIGEAVGKVIQLGARKAAKAHAIAMFTKDNLQFSIVYNIPASAAAATQTITMDNTVVGTSSTTANGRINMIVNGTMLDQFNAAGTTKLNTVPLVATNVNHLAGTFVLRLADSAGVSGGGAAGTITITEDDQLVLYNSRTASQTTAQQPAGFNTWMVDAPTVGASGPYGLNLTLHPEFGSLIVSNVGGPLTERVLNQYIGRFMERVGTLCDLDTIITPAGVIHSYLENEDNLAVYERNGRRLDIKAGWADIGYAYNGSSFRWAISSFMEPKACYVVKLKNNIKEYVPPTLKGTATQSQYDNEFRFVAPLGGLNGVFMHVQAGSPELGPGEFLQTPYYRICEIAPDQMQGIILRGLDERI